MRSEQALARNEHAEEFLRAIFPVKMAFFCAQLRFVRFAKRTNKAVTEDRKMQTQEQGNVPTLVAIVMAARRAGDRKLERYARERLLDGHGVKLSFAGPKAERPREGTDDDR